MPKNPPTHKVYYSPGNLSALVGTSTNPYTYNAERLDASTNLHYLRARYLDLTQGRFITRDSYLGQDDDPKTHNLYSYVANDPLNLIDPSGHVMGTGGGGAGISDPNALARVLRYNDIAEAKEAKMNLPQYLFNKYGTTNPDYKAMAQKIIANRVAAPVTTSSGRPLSEGRYLAMAGGGTVPNYVLSQNYRIAHAQVANYRKSCEGKKDTAPKKDMTLEITLRLVSDGLAIAGALLALRELYGDIALWKAALAADLVPALGIVVSLAVLAKTYIDLLVAAHSVFDAFEALEDIQNIRAGHPDRKTKNFIRDKGFGGNANEYTKWVLIIDTFGIFSGNVAGALSKEMISAIEAGIDYLGYVFNVGQFKTEINQTRSKSKSISLK